MSIPGPISLDSIVPGTGLTIPETQRAITVAVYISLSCFAWLVYDYLIFLPSEVEYIWKTRWSATKVLFILNRYLILVIVTAQCFNVLPIGLSDLSAANSLQRCTGVEHFVQGLGLVVTLIVGGAVSLRVYYLWAHRRMVQYLVIFTFTATLVGGIAIVIHNAVNAQVSDAQRQLREVLNSLEPSDAIYASIHTVACFQGLGQSKVAAKHWFIFLILIVYQTLLFVLTVLRVWSSASEKKRLASKTPLLTRIIREGTFFYVAVFSTLALVLIAMVVGQPRISIPVFFSNFMYPVLSISASHLILSIRSLAATVSNEPAFLLNETEMTRLYQLHGIREGRTEGEVLVDVALPPSESELPAGRRSRSGSGFDLGLGLGLGSDYMCDTLDDGGYGYGHGHGYAGSSMHSEAMPTPTTARCLVITRVGVYHDGEDLHAVDTLGNRYTEGSHDYPRASPSVESSLRQPWESFRELNVRGWKGFRGRDAQ